MPLIIDGYNLLNSVGITGRGSGPGGFERSRAALLNFLAESLDAEEAAQTTVVFDAAASRPGLPRVLEHRGLKVRFAAGYPDADTLIEELIQADTTPRRLTVVSSDHRLQRAARRRKAAAIDSDVWYRRLVERRRRQASPPAAPARPPLPLSEAEVRRWLDEFGGEEAFDKLLAEEAAETPGAAEQPDPGEPHAATGPPPDKLSPREAAEIGNPFPPGYAEDLTDEPLDDDLSNPFPPGYGEDLQP